MYPWERVNPKQDSTLRIIHECVIRGHEVAITHAQNLTIRDCVTLSYCKTIRKADKFSQKLPLFYRSLEFEHEMRSMRDFDVIFMRDNPPLDPLVLNFLDSVKDDVFMINAIDGLREANNKIYTAAYYDPEHSLIPTTHVSKNIDYLMRVIKDHEGDKMIMKPLDGFGGRGVIVIEKSAMQNIKSLLEFYINKAPGQTNYVILQDFVEGAENGDVRVIMLNGKPIGALRRRPPEGDVRSNISAGGSVEKYKLSREDKLLCERVGKKLVQDGIYYAGLDIIGAKLIEINVLSPGTITDINKLYGIKIQRKIIDYLENVVEERTKNINTFRAEDLFEE